MIRIVDELDTPGGALKSALNRAKDFDGVIIIALNKDGTQWLTTSMMSMHQKAFLISFAQSWVLRWFHSEDRLDG